MIFWLVSSAVWLLSGLGFWRFTRLTCPPGTPYKFWNQALVVLLTPVTLAVFGIQLAFCGLGELGYYYKGWTKE